MYAVIYRFYLKPEKVETYKKLWDIVSEYFVSRRGALGSCLQQADDGMFVVYSRWPDKATRNASWPGEDAPSDELPDEVRQAVIEMHACADDSYEKLPDIEMKVLADKL